MKGERLRTLLDAALAGEPGVGEIRGRGLLIGIELVADPETRAPFPRAAQLTETVVRAARERGVLLYSSTGCADGIDGDLLVLGPPFVITERELDEVASVVAEAVHDAVAEVAAAAV
jgi:adenosylmethionine-8-amino-7-oxononanoate aminotransferase